MKKLWTAGMAMAIAMAWTNLCDAGAYSNNFSSGIGAASLRGNAVLDSGSIRITPNVSGQIGSFVINNLDPGQVVQTFDASFTLAIGPGSVPPADGVSFSFGPPPPSTYAENGATTGVAISFDLFQNAGESPASPAIRIFVNGVQVAAVQVDPFSAGAFRPVVVHYDSNGLDLTYNSVQLFTNQALPGFGPNSGYQFTFGARTGANSAEQRIDDVSISTTALALGGTPTITVSAFPTTITNEGEEATFTLTISPPSSRQLAVSFMMGGSAAQNSDYVLIGNFNKSGQLIIPSGQSSTTVTLHSLLEEGGDDGPNSSETAVFNLLKGKRYQVGTPNSATVTIQNLR